MDREHVIARLRAHERQLRDAGIVRLSLFGSTARGEAGPDSDIDLLAAFDETRRISPECNCSSSAYRARQQNNHLQINNFHFSPPRSPAPRVIQSISEWHS